MHTSNELRAALAEAVTVAFRELAGVEVTACDEREVSDVEGFAELSAVLKVATRAGEGYFVLSFTEQLGTALAARILAAVTPEPDAEMIRDSLGEVVNVVAGQAKTLLSETPNHFTLGTPTVVTGVPALAPLERLLSTFSSALGEFILHVCLPT